MINWFIFCVLDGIVDGFMFYNRKTYDNNVFGRDIHTFLWLRRCIVGFFMLMLYDLNVVIACICVQPLIHNGFYFLTRKHLDGSYPMGFWTSKDEDTSTAFIDVDNVYARIIIFFLGLAILWM